MTMKNIAAGFKTTGVCPFDRTIVQIQCCIQCYQYTSNTEYNTTDSTTSNTEYDSTTSNSEYSTSDSTTSNTQYSTTDSTTSNTEYSNSDSTIRNTEESLLIVLLNTALQQHYQ